MQTTGHTFKITPSIKREIVKIIDERVREVHVTKEDFSELKAIVKELAEAQKELAEAQKRTEEELRALSGDVRTLTGALHRTRQDLGGLSRTFSYAFENEAYRMLPKILEEKYGLTLKDKVIRAEIGGKEINFFGKAEKEGREVYIVGEAKTRLDNTRKEDIFEEVEDKVRSVKKGIWRCRGGKAFGYSFCNKGIFKEGRR
jgi:predicted nuclease with TOPRIM domain